MPDLSTRRNTSGGGAVRSGSDDGAVRSELTGWGRTAATAADVVHAVHPDVVDTVMSAAVGDNRSSRGLIARGLGRSYGDAAQNAGGTVIDATWLDAIHHVDLDAGLITVGGGVSLQTLMERFVPLGWFVPVTPGTRLVTVGGAIAADIHGKNHHVDGSFCSHVTRMTLVTPTGTVELTPASDPELFWATAGGMGLTGVVTQATLQMIPVETSYMLVDTERASDLDDVMSKMISGDDGYRYSVAWIDCQSGGSKLGRSVLTRGDHARMDELPPALQRSPGKARAFVTENTVQRGDHSTERPAQPAHRRSVQRVLVPQGTQAPGGQTPSHDRVLPPPRWGGSVEPPLRQAGLSPVPVRGGRRTRRDGPAHHRALGRAEAGIVPGRVETVRAR